MTIANTTRLVEYTGNGVQTAFFAGFAIPQKDDCVVSTIEISSGTETILDPSVFGFVTTGTEAGATITYPLSGSPLSSSFKLRITRKVVPLQPFSQSNQDAYDAGTVETAFDRVTLMAQDSYARADAALSAVQGATNFIDFDQRYLGAKTSDPGTDNNGNALLDGALYYNSVTKVMRVYDLGTTTWSTISGLTAANNLNDVGNKFTSRANLGVFGRVQDSASTITLDATHAGTMLNCTAAQTVNLPAIAGLSANYMVRIRAFSGAVTVDANGSELINGATTLIISTGGYADLFASTSGWIAVSSDAQFVTNINISSAVGNHIVDVPVGMTKARLWVEAWNPTSTSGINMQLRFGTSSGFIITNNYYVSGVANTDGTLSGASIVNGAASITASAGRGASLSEMAHGVVELQGFNTAGNRITFTGQTQCADPSLLNIGYSFQGRLFGLLNEYTRFMILPSTSSFDRLIAKVEWFA